MADSSFLTVDVTDGISLGQLLEEMEMDADEIKSVSVNGVYSDLERILSDGDKVALYPIEAGLRRRPLDGVNAF